MAIGRPLNLTANVASKNISVLATAGQTSFTVTGGYRINEIAVYRNGTRLVDGRDFTATDGSIVTLVSAATIYDVIEYQIFDSFDIADAVGTSGDSTINGNLTITGNTTLSTLGVSIATTSKDLLVTGVSTFTGTVDANGAIDVDGHTELDDVNVSGASTFSGAADFNGAIDVDGHTELDDVNVSGAITATTFTGNLTGDASGLTGTPDITVRNITGVAATFTGVVTYEDVTNVDSLGIITARGGFEIGAAGVGGTITSVGNAEFAGITTASKFSGPGNIPGPSQSGTVTLAASDAGKFVSAGSGGVTLPASTLAVGEGITIYNNHSGDITLTCSAPTAVYLGTDGSTKTSITLATRCICTFFCVDASSDGTYVCVGGGIS